ncbi:MAG: hypothetical protein IJR68_07875 [Fretibacterium sp.]|nr:hypothetical protein [Fretibacterium sp.]
MEELVISPDFTMEDIEKIREYHMKREKLIGKEAFWAEIKADALWVRNELKARGAREKILRQDIA